MDAQSVVKYQVAVAAAGRGEATAWTSGRCQTFLRSNGKGIAGIAWWIVAGCRVRQRPLGPLRNCSRVVAGLLWVVECVSGPLGRYIVAATFRLCIHQQYIMCFL